ncbi:MAG: UDP-N-acetyl-alpha-D-muramoyl-L-alanyl-L-glutamate epimerase [Actinomycetota bacterium]|jgi:hypothetical protein|nr:UDP-N-acetyl-alpha-D-muramoyl-L-alanyl-L-glutamate epimerase [Actinomycetota bacterium]
MPVPSVEDPEADRRPPTRGATFVLLDRTVDVEQGRATFSYDLDGDGFREELRFPPGGDPGDPAALGDLLDLCHVVIGTSYFKLRAPTRLVVTQPVSAALLEVCRQTYDQGLRELAVTNGLELPLATEIEAEVRAGTEPAPRPPLTCGRPLVPIGGGKDSAAVLGLLPGATGITVSATAVQRKLAAAAGVELLEVDRVIDPKLLRLTPSGFNGHIPITAINSAISSLVAYLFGYDCVVMGNERSASEPTRVVGGVPVNHQYSKSFDYERALHDAIAPTGVNYFSLLRQLSELSIARLVSRDLRLRGSFLSCNRAFVRSRDPEQAQAWCLECPKCLFTFLCFAPFSTLAEADEVFGGNPLADLDRTEGFRDLWRPDAKPFDCVGERMESAAAMTWLGRLPDWSDLPVVRALVADASSTAASLGADVESVLAVGGPHLIPPEMLALVTDATRR